MKSTRTVVAMLLAAAVFGGCSEAPVVEENSAAQALNTADQAQASKYASTEWQMAQDTLLAAKAAKVEQDGRFAPLRSYGKSKSMFERAAQLAEQAESKALAELQRVRAETESLLAQTRVSLDSLAMAMVTLPVGKDNKAEIELMKQDVAAYQQQLENAQADFDRADYESAISKTRAVSSRAAVTMNSVRAAMAAKATRKKA